MFRFILRLAVLSGGLVFASGSSLAFAEEGKGAFHLVDNGKSNAAIVISDNPAPSAREAAEAFRKVIEQMSGAAIPIMPESRIVPGQPMILVGMSDVGRRAGIDIVQDEDAGERYVVQVSAERIVLVGNDDGPLRGSAFAVYDLLQRLGCGWYGPDPVWHVIPKRDTIAVPVMRIDERPAFAYRHVAAVGSVGRPLTDAWRQGGKHIAHPHALDSLLPREKLIKDHPDYFGAKQLCLTHPEVIDIVAKQFRERIAKAKGIATFSLSANDSLGFCDCLRCRAVGNASACNLYFANAIARELARTHPGRYLLTFYAFWGTHDAPFPMLQAEPGVCVMIVNEGNHLHPVDERERPDITQIIDRSNTREMVAIDGWKRTGAVLGVYEWWIPACNHPDWLKSPWYGVETALRNLRLWHREGVKYLVYQSDGEEGTGFPLRWPLYYAGARGSWDPNVDARQIMCEACAKLYGPAADAMQRYYAVFEKAMDDCQIPVKSWRLPSPEKVYSAQTESAAGAALDEAGRLATDADAKARLAQERAQFDRLKALLADLRKAPRDAEPSKANPGM